MVRLWVDGEDYGTKTEQEAADYRRLHARTGENIKIESVASDAPEYLPVEDGTGTP